MKISSKNLDKKRVVIAMSGGVDSSVAAALLVEQGYEVIGLTLKLWEPPATETYHHTSCCSVEDITDARRVADQLNIPFYVVNAKENFKKSVVNPFVSEYLQGRTPNPCALCNDKVKFGFLLERAFELGAYYVATGHFARKVWDEKSQHYKLLQGNDLHKDQTYFLFSLGQTHLEHTLFPVGELSKDQVRSLAAKYSLKTRSKPESQEICFVPKTHGDFIEKYLGKKMPEGSIIDETGKVLGQHEGIHRYTLGQRRGTQVATGDRRYVKAIDAKTNTITMAPNDSLYQSKLMATQVRWVRPVADGSAARVRVRYRHQGSEAKLFFEDEAKVRVEFEEPQRAITPGQAVVFYQGDEVLGGGWIQRSWS